MSNILTDEEIKTLQKMRTPFTLAITEDDEEMNERMRRKRNIEAMRLKSEKIKLKTDKKFKNKNRAIKLINYSEPGYNRKQLDPIKSRVVLEEICLQDICDHLTPLGESNLENNTCKLCNMKVYPISGKNIKVGIKNNIFSTHVKIRILQAIGYKDYFKNKGDISRQLNIHYNDIKNHKTYYINLFGGIYNF